MKLTEIISMKKVLSLLLCICIISTFLPLYVLASSEWPADIVLQADGGIVIDADTGAVIYGTNIHEQYFPASITKILTALVVIENCDLDETVTFSRNAVFNLEAGSTIMEMDVGDTLSVRDCLHGLLLRSANEVANALAEHTAGSIEEFAVMMNEKARQLGCENSNFVNPSGLNDPNHMTTAYDMALISKAAFENEIFVEIDSKLYHDIPATKRNPEGMTVYMHHRMMKKNDSVYYPGIIGGKTGYTSLAGNTLVTCAERDGFKLITVILNGHQTHYSDTKNLLDFGFNQFQSVPAASYDTSYLPVENDMTIAGLTTTDFSSLQLDENSKITLPKAVDFTAVTSELIYNSTDNTTPPNAIAKVQYTFGDRRIGSAYLLLKESDKTIVSVSDIVIPLGEEETSPEETGSSSNTTSRQTPTPTNEPREKRAETNTVMSTFWVVFVAAIFVIILLTLLSAFILHKKHKEEEARLQRRQRRLDRLASNDNISASEFESLLEKKRIASSYKRPEGFLEKIKAKLFHRRK